MIKRDDKNKIIYYENELTDDFMNSGIKREEVPNSFKFVRNNKIYNFFSNILYFGIAKPILRFFNFCYGVRYKNLKNLKKIKNEGAFIYGNHTSIFDMFTIQACIVRFKRTEIIGYSDVSNVKILKNIARNLGYLPLPLSDLNLTRKLIKAIEFYINKKHHVLIFPEAHVWPFYTDIRPFSSASFHYPTKLNARIIPIVATYRKVWYSKKPRITYVVGEVIAPIESNSIKENKEYLRNECFKQMKEIAKKYNQINYYKYIKTDKEN